jgi:fluoroquinolone transport system permease protein
MKTLVMVAINDFRLVFRDSSLKIFIILPLMTLLVVRYAVPHIAGMYPGIEAYIPIILMLATMQGATAFGFIYSMVLVDEKDTAVARVYGILPVSKFWFVVFRLFPPFALATIATFLLLVAEPFFGFPWVASFVYSILAGLTAPIMTLFVATVSNNKIEAMTWQKLFNLPLFLPVLVFFVPVSISFVFAIFPAFWAYKGFDALINGGVFWLFMLAGFVHSLVLIVLVINRFTRNHFR